MLPPFLIFLLLTSQRVVSDPPFQPTGMMQCTALNACECTAVHTYGQLHFNPFISHVHMFLVRFYLLCYGYESTFCWLTKKWSVLDVCIVTQISNLKYNRDQKTVFVTVCFCLHLGDIVRSRPRSAGKETREGPSLVRAFSRGSPLLATRNGEISRRANCYMVKYCNTYTKFPSLKKAWIGSACKSKLPIKQYRLDQRRKRVKN